MSRMGLELAALAALMGDVSRANILGALMDGRALTALELSLAAGVTPQTTSSHLAKLKEAGLLVLQKQGRHRYYRLASAQVARTVESLMALTADGPPRHRAKSKLDDELAAARTCYDHIAGRLGVSICDALVEREYVVFDKDAGEVTAIGHEFFAGLGIDLLTAAKYRRVFCRPCLDWTERRPHVAGRLGAEIADLCFTKKWLTRNVGTRALTVTGQGSRALPLAFGIDLFRVALS
jgi:DNA-binding transcriptional ArsR family regulator